MDKEFNESLDHLLDKFKSHIIKLKDVCHSTKELEVKLQIQVDSLNVTIYSLLQEELQLNEKIQKKHKR